MLEKGGILMLLENYLEPKDKVFLTALPKSDAYKRIETKLPYYFVLVHDKGGTILCHNDFNQPRRL